MAIVIGSQFTTADANAAQSGTGTFSFPATVFDVGVNCLRTNPTTTANGAVEFRSWSSNSGVQVADINKESLYIDFLFRVDTAPSANDEPIAIVQYTTNPTTGANLEIRINSSRQLVVYDTTLTLVATGTTALSTGTQYRIQVRSQASATGAYEVKINGVSELSGTCNQTATNSIIVAFGKRANRNGRTVDFYYGRVVVDDAEFHSDIDITAMAIDGNGNYTAWTGDYQDVDETPPHDTDTTYVTSSTSGQAETWSLQSAAAAGITGTVHAVQAILIVRDEGGASALRYRLRSGSTDSDNATNNDPGSSYVGRGRLLTTDPATSAAWLLAALDSIEVGVVNNANVAARCTLAIVEVFHTAAAASGNPWYAYSQM